MVRYRGSSDPDLNGRGWTEQRHLRRSTASHTVLADLTRVAVLPNKNAHRIVHVVVLSRLF